MVGKVVLTFQHAFVKGRQILNAVRIANKAIDSRKKCANKGIICRLDIEMGFDHVNWDFLFAILDKMSFRPKWISWINWYISMICFFILVNGTPSSCFKSSKGLR